MKRERKVNAGTLDLQGLKDPRDPWEWKELKARTGRRESRDPKEFRGLKVFRDQQE